MSSMSVVESVKERVASAKTQAIMVTNHGREVFKAGAMTARAAKDVVAEARRELVEVAVRRQAELKQTLKDGVAHMGDRMSRLATPNRKEQAAMRKAEVKARKQSKRADMSADPNLQVGA